MQQNIDGLVILLIAYFVGSIPFGPIITRLAGYGNLRKMGSGNIGATNVLRGSGNRKIAGLVLGCDILKSYLPCYVTHAVIGNSLLTLSVGLLVILGHVFPLHSGFKGGKGVASFIGFILHVRPMCVLLFLAIWLVLFKLFRYASLSSIVASSAVGVLLMFLQKSNHEAMIMGYLVFLIIYTHRENIARLCTGNEMAVISKNKKQ